MNALWVFIGGGLGSLLRFGVSKLLLHWFDESPSFPLATLVSNLLASALLAYIILFSPAKFSESQRHFWAVGFCGGFSTFSTFSLENWLLIDQKAWLYLGLNLALSLALGLLVMLVFSRSVSG